MSGVKVLVPSAEWEGKVGETEGTLPAAVWGQEGHRAQARQQRRELLSQDMTPTLVEGHEQSVPGVDSPLGTHRVEAA